MDVYLVVVQDTIVQSREYAVMVPKGSSADEVKEKIQKGEFLTEGEPTFVEAIEPSRIISAEKVGQDA